MTDSTSRRLATLAVAAFVTCLCAGTAGAADAPVPNKGDTAWMLAASALVLVMTIPGLALFYGGLVRTKNMLSILMQVLYTVCIVSVLWVIYGYSLAFSEGGAFNGFIGGLSKGFLAGITPDSVAETFSDGVVIPELVYVAFQMTFAAITPALIIGALAERMKFAAIVLFIPLWATFVYFPIAHMVWYWGGPAATASTLKALAAAGAEGKAAAKAAADQVAANAGIIFQWGAIDFAGGTVVHINAGIAGLVGCLVLGKRVGYGREAMPPHSLTMCLIGTGLLWFGWFGFNAGSALEANGTAALAMVNTFVATAAASLAWMLGEKLLKGKPSLLGGASGAVAGLVAVTPAAGYAGPMGAIVLGAVAGFVCLFFVDTVKNKFSYDDALDVFGVHCVGGIIGALGTAIVAAPVLGGAGLFDYALGKAAADYSIADQIVKQAYAVVLTLCWSGVISFLLFHFVKLVVGLRPPIDHEREGLDLVDHGERAYNY